MITPAEDLELFNFLISLSEIQQQNQNNKINYPKNNLPERPRQDIDHTKNVQKMENAKNIIKEKMKNATPQGKEYLQKQHDMIDKQHQNAQQNEQAEKMHRRAMIKQIHNDAVNNMIKDEQARKNGYDENNSEHKAIIQQYHKQRMEKVRAAKTTNTQNNNQKPQQNNTVQPQKPVQNTSVQKTTAQPQKPVQSQVQHVQPVAAQPVQQPVVHTQPVQQVVAHPQPVQQVVAQPVQHVQPVAAQPVAAQPQQVTNKKLKEDENIAQQNIPATVQAATINKQNQMAKMNEQKKIQNSKLAQKVSSKNMTNNRIIAMQNAKNNR